MLRPIFVIAVAILGPGGATSARETPAAELKRTIEENYSYQDVHPLDWPVLLERFGPRLDDADFVSAARELLSEARDVHITLQSGSRKIQPYRREVQTNYDLALIPKLILDVKSDHRCVSTGHAAGDIGYIIVGAWTGPCSESAHAALDGLGGASALIIDVRPNNGGDDRLAIEIASRFTNKPMVYAFVETFAKGRLGPRRARLLQPSQTHRHFGGKVAILMGPRCMSSNESFLLMMRATGALLVGERSYGSSGNSRPHPLFNGVVLWLPSWRELQPDGSLVQGMGIAPDVSVAWSPADQDDAVLRTAIARLSATKN